MLVQHCINVIQIFYVYWDLCDKNVTRVGGNVICCNPREDVVPSTEMNGPGP